MEKPGFWFWVRLFVGLPVLLIEIILIKLFKWQSNTEPLYSRWIFWSWK